MRPLPRVAVGTVQPSAEREPIVWGLLAALHAAGREVSQFHSASYLRPHDAARSLTSSGSRHLDSWAMSRTSCLRALYRTSEHTEFAVVEGDFLLNPVRDTPVCDTLDEPPGSSLPTLCDWLDLPRVAIIDLADLDPCRLPRRPERLDGLLLDRAIDARHAAHWQTTFEALWKAPVLGWLDRAESLRSLCRTLPDGRDPSPALCGALGRRLAANLRFDRLLALADRSPLPEVPIDDLGWELPNGPLRIAVAYDEDFCGYFPDTLDLLEEAGAELCDFSPLHSGQVPDGADVVYIGCGHPERHPDVLAGNHCLQQSLRTFAASGGRIYAEGSGLAYLCREIVLPGESRIPMTGLLPAVAHWSGGQVPPQPVELCFRNGSWMIDAGIVIRGYRQSAWRIEPVGPMTRYADDPRQDLDMLGRGNVIGSQITLNLGANEHLLRSFVQPAAHVAVRTRRK
jgi:cobyrinic acid a,c-diamide synthase